MSQKCCTVDQHQENEVVQEHDSNHLFEKIGVIIGSIFLVSGFFLESFQVEWFQKIHFFWYFLPYLLVAAPVFKEMFALFAKKDFLNEISLMSLATIGAFAIESYSEGLAVMIFYLIGEFFEHSAVHRAKKSIKELLDISPTVVFILKDNNIISRDPKTVEIGETLEVKPGEKVGLDGILESDETYFNTVALTGESLPRLIKKGEAVLAGMIPLHHLTHIKVSKLYKDSTLSRILKLVEESAKHKSPTETLIRRFARIYTPIVFILALLLLVVPYFFVESYQFSDWLYRSLVFLVASCPCAFVISIPLGFFSGIGIASHNGILIKGGNYLDALSRMNTLLTDKTGTMTTGVLSVEKVYSNIDENLFLSYVASIEKNSRHPIAQTIVDYISKLSIPLVTVSNFKELPGKGIQAKISEKSIFSGTYKFLSENQIQGLPDLDEYKNIRGTLVCVAYDGKYIGYIEVADQIKETSAEAVSALKKMGIKTVMLSGDRNSVTHQTAQMLGIDESYGELLPDQKITTATKIKPTKGVVGFLGDGINDAPLLALTDVGIAMGALGSELAIETADIVLQVDDPMKVVQAIQISKATNFIVWQNIIFALIVKIVVLTMGAMNQASLWDAIFADLGVSILTILNALRLQYKKF